MPADWFHLVAVSRRHTARVRLVALLATDTDSLAP